MAYILGITGGISSGKTRASACLAGDRVHIIEVDDLARPLLEIGSECYNDLINRFGNQICMRDGRINRKRFARIAFSNQRRAEILNEIFKKPLTRAIKLEIMQGRANRSRLIVVVASILYEQEWNTLCHGVLNISAPEQVRIQRSLRRGFSERDVSRRIAIQLDEKERMQLSDWTIYTQPTKEMLCDAIRRLVKSNKWI